MHMLVTLRAKTETAQQEGQNGKKNVVKLGMKAEQRDGFEYEMTIVLDLAHDGNYATATKDRTGLYKGKGPFVVSEQTGVDMRHGWSLASKCLSSTTPELLSQDQVDDHVAAINATADEEGLKGPTDHVQGCHGSNDTAAITHSPQPRTSVKATLAPAQEAA